LHDSSPFRWLNDDRRPQRKLGSAESARDGESNLAQRREFPKHVPDRIAQPVLEASTPQSPSDYRGVGYRRSARNANRQMDFVDQYWS